MLSRLKSNLKFDVYGLGNAIVDLLVFTDDLYLQEISLQKGHMTLADSKTQAYLLKLLDGKEIRMVSGGSAANTMAAIAKAGGKAFYTGKIAKDPYGEFYRFHLLEEGVHFDVHPVSETQGSTATCVVLITPDAERTMSTHLGASILLTEEDIHKDVLKDSKVLYIEGYLWLNESTRKAAKKAMELAKEYQIPVSFTFSDQFVVEQFKEEFYSLVRSLEFHILFMNSEEAKSFVETKDLYNALEYLKNFNNLIFVTNNKHGSFVIENHTIYEVSGFPVEAIDSTGAGDVFAGGVLFGLTNGYDSCLSAKIGNFLASKIVQIQGARFNKSYQDEIKRMLFNA
ncbi:MAG: adenosine kinase [Leptonema sp. (in: bacteria)]